MLYDVKLIYNKIITPRGSDKTSKGGYTDYSYFDSSKRTKGGETIARNIQWYRMWWTYLRLALEIEQKRIRIDGKLIRVSRRFYKLWSIDEILDSSFDSWWETHRHLFQEEQIETLPQGTQNSLPDYLYLKIPKRRNKSELLRELDLILKNNLKGDKEILFPFSKSAIPYIRLHIEYNCLVMAFNGVSRKEIMRWVNPKYKDISGVVQERYDEVDGIRIEKPFNYEQSVTRVIRKGKDRIKRVTKGIFP